MGPTWWCAPAQRGIVAQCRAGPHRPGCRRSGRRGGHDRPGHPRTTGHGRRRAIRSPRHRRGELGRPTAGERGSTSMTKPSVVPSRAPCSLPCGWCATWCRTCGPAGGDGCAASRRIRSSSPFPGWRCPTRRGVACGCGRRDRRLRPRRRAQWHHAQSRAAPARTPPSACGSWGAAAGGPWETRRTSAVSWPSCVRRMPAS